MEDYPDEVAVFIGKCTCDHADGDHGHFGCEVRGCECGAFWDYEG